MPTPAHFRRRLLRIAVLFGAATLLLAALQYGAGQYGGIG